MSSKIEITRDLAEKLFDGASSMGWSVARQLRKILDAPVVERQPDAIIEGCMTSVGITHAIYASTVSLKDKEQVRLYREPPERSELQAKLELASRMFDEVENSLADSCSREAELQATIATLKELLGQARGMVNGASDEWHNSVEKVIGHE
jgi:hypothetical protein